MKPKVRWSQFFLVGLIVLLAGLVTACGKPAPPPTTITPQAPAPASAIGWSEAKHHIGERATVYGAVVDTRWASGSKGKPTFLNIGRPYPDSDRFTVVIWIDYRANFPQAPEGYYLGKTIYVTGLITEYEGIPQIEVKDPSQIAEQ